ncbi:hypothetical protein [Streptosporangium sp. 'caverna']|uniref:hypothetical protein n=1 Tax=Streptosporangium sp. 'caverna' TaxID=2202249 RepID=UPI0013A6F7A6|nr:hypothetical protein [Streptosporangium sp. 'caverna']
MITDVIGRATGITTTGTDAAGGAITDMNGIVTADTGGGADRGVDACGVTANAGR